MDRRESCARFPKYVAGDGGITVGDESLSVELRREEERRVWLGEAAILLGDLIVILYVYHEFSRIMQGQFIAIFHSALMKDDSVLGVALSHFPLLGEKYGITTPSRGLAATVLRGNSSKIAAW